MSRSILIVVVATNLGALATSEVVQAKSEGGQKRRIERRYEAVAWGKKQSLRDNLFRSFKAGASKGTDWSVYQQRYKDLDFHWEEMKRKGIDPREETLYFGYISWSTDKGLLSDHYVRFYVAARKLSRDQQLANELQGYKRPQLKKALESLEAEELSVLDLVDRRTLQIALTIVDKQTLMHILENIDVATLRVALEVMDRPTLMNGITRIDRPTLKHAVQEMDRETLTYVLSNVDPATLTAISEVIDDETYSVALAVVTNSDVRARIAAARR
ncbi:MAG: hypothetical protein AB7O68_11440 [Pirellulales bacterium]